MSRMIVGDGARLDLHVTKTGILGYDRNTIGKHLQAHLSLPTSRVPYIIPPIGHDVNLRRLVVNKDPNVAMVDVCYLDDCFFLLYACTHFS